MTARSVDHASFTIERTYDATPERVFNAFADIDAKKRWFKGPDEWDEREYALDFREGGRESNAGGPPEGPVHTFRALYYDIVPNERIVISYEMYEDDVRLSVSLTTIEFTSVKNGTRLVFTEQGAFLDGHEDPSLREEGTRGLMEALAGALASERAPA
jgi:uncharacterized protein YndB with AHSA1/START domain